MSSVKRESFLESYPRRLDELRRKIDSLPEQQRPAFLSAVDQAERQHNRMQKTCAGIHDTLADMGLMVAHTKCHVEACRRELRQVDPHGHFQL